MPDMNDLIAAATKARDNAYAPYSRHPVGAAVLTSSGTIYSGCNVENAAYPLGNCAEQAAIAAMIMGGDREITEIVIVGPSEAPCTPCGGCRQRIREFAAPETKIHMATPVRVLMTMTLNQLLPESFGPENLK